MTAKRWIWAFAAGALVSGAGAAHATMGRNPTGVNVATDSPTTLVIRFADSAGANFSTTEAIFCSVDPTGGAGVGTTSCTGAGGRILGRLPSALDRGSTSSASKSITDVMTIPFSVTRRAVVNARSGAPDSDFFYVRKFVPAGGADIGGGPGVTVFVTVTCRLTGGTARTPLSLTKVLLYGDEGKGEKVLLVRIDDANREQGVVKADINYTGTGILSGWWEVRQPGDPEIQTIDRFTEASLPESERAKQQRFTRVRRFRVQLLPSGRLTLVGPNYNNLPQSQPGVYSLLLRVEVSTDRESLSTLGTAGGSTNLYSGAAAGFPLPVLEYRVGLMKPEETSRVLRPSLEIAHRPAGPEIRVRWAPVPGLGPLVEVTATDPSSGESRRILAPMDRQFLILPPEWSRDRDISRWQYNLKIMSKDGKTIGAPIPLVPRKPT